VSASRDTGIDPRLLPPLGSPAALAARQFRALPLATRHAWLAQHITALRSGQLPLSEIP
jgi:hypothetical protein